MHAGRQSVIVTVLHRRVEMPDRADVEHAVAHAKKTEEYFLLGGGVSTSFSIIHVKNYCTVNFRMGRRIK